MSTEGFGVYCVLFLWSALHGIDVPSTYHCSSCLLMCHAWDFRVLISSISTASAVQVTACKKLHQPYYTNSNTLLNQARAKRQADVNIRFRWWYPAHGQCLCKGFCAPCPKVGNAESSSKVAAISSRLSCKARNEHPATFHILRP